VLTTTGRRVRKVRVTREPKPQTPAPNGHADE
jgi:hypothetical protein